MHVLVAGCGWLGAEIARRAVVRGDRVTGVRRDPSRAAPLRALGVELLSVDLSGPHAVDRLPPAEAIVACQAARVEEPKAYEAAYLRANESLLTVASRWGARMVYTGSTGVFGQRDGSTVDEAVAPAPATPTARVLLEAESMLLSAASAGTDARVVRLSGLYGPGRVGIIERVRSGKLCLGSADEVWMNFCHVEDAASFVLAALSVGPPGAIFHGSDAGPARRRDVVSWIAKVLGILPHRDDTPWLGPNRRILSERTRLELGVSLVHASFREGLAEFLAPHP